MDTIDSVDVNKKSNQEKEMQPTKILVADDEENIVNIVSAYLKKEEYQVIVAYDGEKALELASDHQSISEC